MVGTLDWVPNRGGLSSWFCHQPFKTIYHLSISVKRDTYLSSVKNLIFIVKINEPNTIMAEPHQSLAENWNSYQCFYPILCSDKTWVRKIQFFPKTYKQTSLRPSLPNTTIRNIDNHEEEEWERKGICQGPTTPPLPLLSSQGPPKASSNHLPAEELDSPC